MSVDYTPGEWTTKVRQRVRAAIGAADTSATEVARHLGWTQQYISRRLMARNPIPFSVAEIEGIARVLGMDPAALIDDRSEVAA